MALPNKRLRPLEIYFAACHQAMGWELLFFYLERRTRAACRALRRAGL